MEEQTVMQNKSDTPKKKVKHKGLIIAGSILGGFVILVLILYFVLTCNTQIIVGFIQKATYGDNPFNSYEPYYEPIDGKKDNGQYLISEIKYDTEYPNSYLDITYPDENRELDRPTLFYFHGGGFFAGSKNMGDPMAEIDATALIDDICAAGYNIVNVDYALVPDCRFPVPLIQANRAFAYIQEHAAEYHLNMDNVVIMGSSAGAIITSQLGSIITNPEYAELLGIIPAFKPEQVKAVILDDAPLDYEKFSFATKILVGNYVKGSIYLNKNEIKKYNNIKSLTANYPAAVLLGSEYRHDMNVIHEALQKLGCGHILIDPYAERGETKQHCFVASERVDPVAKDAFDRMMAFINERTKYDVVWDGGEPYSICEDFIDKDTELVSAWRIMKIMKRDNATSLYRHYVNCCGKLGVGIVPALDRMIVLDYLIANEDRHLNNFGLVRNAYSMEWLGAAPIYDSGSSLGYDKTERMIDMETEIECKPFKKHHEEQLKLVSFFDWIDFDALFGIEHEITSVLSETDGLVSEARKEAIVQLVLRRIGRLKEFAGQHKPQEDRPEEDVTENLAKTYKK